MHFENPHFSNQSIDDLDSENVDKASNAILSICLYSGDYDLSIASIRKCLKHSDDNVIGCAIVSIGHTARIWRKLPTDLIEEVKNARRHDSPFVRGQAESAIDDVNFFIETA